MDAKAAEAKSRGNAAFAAKNFEEAIAHFTEAISHTRDHVFFSNRSACHASLENYDLALKDGEECVRMKPDWPKGYARKAFAEFFLKRYDDAAETYKAGLKLSPEDVAMKDGLQKVMDVKYDVHQACAEEDDFLSKFDANALTVAAARNPRVKTYMEDPELMKKLTALIGMGSSTSSAREHLATQLIQQDPRILEVIAASQGLVVKTEASRAPPCTEAQQPKAKVDIQTSKADEPTKQSTPEQKEAEEFKKKGNEFYKKRKFSEALEMYDEALSKVPDDLTFHNNKCAVWMEMGEENFPKVLQTCQDLLTKRYNINSRNPGGASFEKVAKVYNRMASVYEKQGKFDDAIAMYNKALTEDNNRQTRNALRQVERAKEKNDKEQYLDSAKAQEHKEKGNACFKANQMVEAKQEYDEAIKRNPSDAKLFSNRAAALTKLLAFPDALRDLDECLRLEPTFVKAYSRKGAAHFYLKEYHKALEAYDKGLALDKGNEECKRGREQVVAKIMESQGHDVDEEQVQHALADPEIQSMLHDPQVRLFLKTLQENPAEGQKAMRADPKLADIVSKLVAAGIIRTR